MKPETDPFEGDGEVRALARSLDWSATALGPPAEWPCVLIDTVRTCLDSPFPINIWCGPELTLIYNDAYSAVLGSKHPHALGRPGAEVWSEIWPTIAPLFERIRHGGPPVYAEDAPFVVSRADEHAGDPTSDPNAWFTFSLSPVRDREGEVVAFLNIVAETTGRVLAERAQEAARSRAEAAEARLREVFAQAPAFLAVLRGPEHVFEYVNDAYYRVVGDRPLVGLPAMEALPEVRGQGFRQLLDRVLETGEPFVGREMPIELASRPGEPPEERFLDFVYYPITEPDGTRPGVVAHGSDVTEHVLARREAQRARREAEQANLAKSQFLATMSHEVRTPINAVLGYADLLDAGVAGAMNERQAQYVDAIRMSSRHLLGLVSEVLDLAKMEAGEMSVRVQEVDPRAAVAAAVDLVRPQAEQKELGLEEEWKCGAVSVLADDARLRQILANLLSNAVKFTDEGGRITTRCRSSETAPSEGALPEVGPWVVLEVEDTGGGIAPEQKARVFEPFVQVESGHTRQAGGTGLGLTISRRLARLMGGELTVHSELGSGSRFSLWLPPARGPQERTEMAQEAAQLEWPPEAEEVAGLGSAGRALLSAVEKIEEEWASRLRVDARVASAQNVSRAQVVNQTAELVTSIAKTLLALEEGGGDPGLLEDADAIRSLVARRHGHQRRRLGWSRSELEREYHLLAEVLDDTLRREAPRRTAADLSKALSMVERLVRRSRDGSLAAFERKDTAT